MTADGARPAPGTAAPAAGRARPALGAAVLTVLALLVCLATRLLPSGGGLLRLIPAGAALLLFTWAPGLAAARLLLSDLPPDDPAARWGFPLALGPIVSTGAMVLADLAGLPLRTAAFVPGVLALVVFLIPARARDAGAWDPAPAAPRDRGRILLLAGGTAVLCALVLAGNPWLSWRADGRFHIGVAGEILRAGLPPDDPFFSGLALQYMWFFHAMLAALMSLSGAGASLFMASINVVAAFAFTICVWQVVRGFGRSPFEAFLAAVVVLFAMGGLSWIYIPVKLGGMFIGHERGWASVAPMFHLWPPAIGRTTSLFTLLLDQPFLLRKFLVGTAMSMALAAMMLHLEASRRTLFGAGPGAFTLTVLAAFGTIVLHPMMGIPSVAVVTVAAPLLFLWGRWRPFAGSGVTLKGVAAAIMANVAGAVLALPYMLLVTGGKEEPPGLPVDVVPAKLISLVAGSVGILVFAVPWIVRTVRRPGRTRGELWTAGLATGLVLFAAFIRFPLERENIDKPTLLTHLPLALVAGFVIAELWRRGDRKRRRALGVYLALLLIPLNGFLLPTYLLEPDPRDYSPNEKEAFRFIDRSAEPLALVFDSCDSDLPAVEIQRRQYWGREMFASTHQYPKVEMNARRTLRDALYTPGGPDSGSVAGLRAIGAPVYVLVRAGLARPGPLDPPVTSAGADASFAAGAIDPLGRSPAFQRLFDSDDIRVYRLR